MAEISKVVPLKPRAAKTSATKKSAARKTAAKTTAKKKATPKKTTTAAKATLKKSVAKKTVSKAAPKKAAAKKVSAKKSTATKTVTKVAPKKTTVKKPAVKKVTASKKVAEAKKTAKKITTKKTATLKAAKKPAVKKTAAKKPVAKKSVKIAARKRPAQKPKASTNVFAIPTKPQSQLTETLLMNQPNFQQAQAQFDQFTKEAASINREGIDAFVKSSTIFAKGFETLIRETLSISQTAAEKQMQLAKDAMTSKSINEFSDAQNKIAQSSFDDFMSGTTKITEMGVKILTEAIEPINDQIQKSVQKATDAVAAE